MNHGFAEMQSFFYCLDTTISPTLNKINTRLDSMVSEIIKLNPESQAVLKQVK